MKAPACWAGKAEGVSSSELRAAVLQTGSRKQVIRGRHLQVSKLRGSKFQAASRLQKQHFQVPAASFDSFLLPGSREVQEC